MIIDGTWDANVFQFYRSTDTGAPTLNGTVSSAINLFQAILVDGYNSTSSGWTITRSGSTITLSKTSHGFVDKDVINISGLTGGEVGYNANFVVTYVDANTLTTTTASTTNKPTTVSGTPTVKKAGLGWQAAYSGTNIKSWRSPNNKMYLELVETSAATSFTARIYSAMTASATGTDLQTPLQTQTKSVDASTTASLWLFHGNGRLNTFLGCSTSTANAIGTPNYAPMTFGEFDSIVANDAYNGVLITSSLSGVNSGYVCNLGLVANASCVVVRNINQTTTGSYSVKTDVTNIGNINIWNPSISTYAVPDKETQGVVMQDIGLWQVDVGQVRCTALNGIAVSPQKQLRPTYPPLDYFSFTSGSKSGQTWWMIGIMTATNGNMLFRRT